MRALLATLGLAVLACGPKADPQKPTFEDDLGGQTVASDRAASDPTAVPVEPAVARPVAPAGKGLRTGTIERARLVAVLEGGPGAFLRQLEVTPHMDGARFVGWQLVQLLDRNGPLVDVDVAPGDVLLAINGKPLSRPDELQALWDSLRTANTLDADLWRGNAKLRLSFAIEPKVP